MKKPKIAVPLQRRPEEKPPADMRISSHYIGSTRDTVMITARPMSGGRTRAFNPAHLDGAAGYHS